MMTRPPTTATAARAARALGGLPIVSRTRTTVQTPHLYSPVNLEWIHIVPSRRYNDRGPAPPRRSSSSSCGHDGCSGAMIGCRFIQRSGLSTSSTAEYKRLSPSYRCLSTKSETKPEAEEEGQGLTAEEAPGRTSVVVPSDSSEPVSLQIPGSQTGGRKLAIVFTCDVCQTRSAKQFTERSYLHGVVIVRCPGCQNLHLIADRLGYFDDGDGKDWDLSKIAERRGESIRTVSDGDVLEALSLEDLLGRDKAHELLQDQLQHGGKSSDDTLPTSSK